MPELNVGDKVIYRGFGGIRPEATIEHIYTGECAGELDLAIEGTGEVLDRVQRWDGRPEHIMCWEPKPA